MKQDITIIESRFDNYTSWFFPTRHVDIHVGGKIVWKESELESVSVKPHAGVNDGVIDDMNDIEPTYEIVNGTFTVAEIYILIKQIIW